jgi:hypothetical protein
MGPTPDISIVRYFSKILVYGTSGFGHIRTF